MAKVPRNELEQRHWYPRSIKVGGIVSGQVQVQSNSSSDKVGKLTFDPRGPFRITKVLGTANYEVEWVMFPDCAKLEFSALHLTLIPLSL